MGDDEYGPATAARAKWDFVPEEPSGLALTADDELEVWPTDKGWWFARKKRGGYEGYVPRDYVRVEGRHAEAAFPGISARVAAISPRHAEPPPNDHEDELQLALALSLSEAEAALPPRSPRTPISPALSEVVEVLTPPARASAPPPSPSFTEARRPAAAPPPPPPLFDAEALADAALAEVLPPAAPPLPPREPEAMPSPESKPTSPRDGGPRRQSLLKSARRSIRRSLGIPKPAKASPAEVARLRRQAAAAEAEATRLRGALEAVPLDESTECQVCMARAKDTALVPCGHVLCADCVTRANEERIVEECPVCRETVQSTMRVYI